MTETLAATPLVEWHRSAGAQLCPFAGYEMPIQYTSIVQEHLACRSAGALFDVSHMGRLRFDGDGAAELLDHLLTRRVTDLPVGGVRYALVCNEHGGVLDDVLVSHLQTPAGRTFHLLVVNASNRAKILQWITPRLVDFPTVTMTDRTTLTAMIAVQGPHVIAVCSRLFKTDIQRLRYYRGTITEQFGKPVIVTRTGYTGEDGLELIVRADDARRVWENLLLAGRDAGFVAAGLGARDTLRLEAGMPLYGHELSEAINPLEAGLGFACNLAGRSFIGDAALREVQAAGPAKVRVGLLLGGRRPAREGATIVDAAAAPIGQVTSGSPSPTLGRPIAMGYVPPQHAALGSEVQIDIRGRLEPATVASMPFYRKL